MLASTSMETESGRLRFVNPDSTKRGRALAYKIKRLRLETTMRTQLTIALLAAALTTPASAQVTTMPNATTLYPYTPELAVRENVTGQSTIRCRVQTKGSLTECALVTDSPMGYAFGAASIRAKMQSSRRNFHV